MESALKRILWTGLKYGVANLRKMQKIKIGNSSAEKITMVRKNLRGAKNTENKKLRNQETV